jgi:hypothetical protein
MKATRKPNSAGNEGSTKQMDTIRMGRTAHRYQRTALSPVKARFGYSTANDIAARCSIRQRETMAAGYSTQVTSYSRCGSRNDCVHVYCKDAVGEDKPDVSIL